ncbi:hypothetical protein NUG22_12260 [Saccharothrix longispora]|nr:hypothetical protein [Saccharothrix longispora]MDU0289992.1 hypothetical protein [Saccharothrix longispora]
MVLGGAAPVAGPAVTASFAGSTCSCTRATLGELVAWVCGWCLLLEYGVSVAIVAVVPTVLHGQTRVLVAMARGACPR